VYGFYLNLDDINGISLVYNSKTGLTLLNINEAIKSIGITCDETKTITTQPTFLTELDRPTLNRVKKVVQQAGDVLNVTPSAHSDLIPVTYMRDGELGIGLSSLSVIIQKIFSQIYGLSKKLDKSIQTITPREITTSEFNNRMTLLVRNIRKPSRMTLRTKSKNED